MNAQTRLLRDNRAFSFLLGLKPFIFAVVLLVDEAKENSYSLFFVDVDAAEVHTEGDGTTARLFFDVWLVCVYIASFKPENDGITDDGETGDLGDLVENGEVLLGALFVRRFDEIGAQTVVIGTVCVRGRIFLLANVFLCVVLVRWKGVGRELVLGFIASVILAAFAIYSNKSSRREIRQAFNYPYGYWRIGFEGLYERIFPMRTRHNAVAS